MKKNIWTATLVAGTLDILAAFAQAYSARKTSPDIVLRYIASGIFGESAYSGGLMYPLAGLLFHFVIVLACVVVYFKLYPKIGIFKKNVFLSGLFIALIAWAVTTRVVVPLSKINPLAFDLKSAGISVAILWLCVGLPISFFAKQYYRKVHLSRW